jgi:REP element-mobilizing transposase RayT
MAHRRFVDLKRLILPGAVYFVSVKTQHNFPYFRERIFCDLFVEELKWCRQIKQFKLFAWFLGVEARKPVRAERWPQGQVERGLRSQNSRREFWASERLSLLRYDHFHLLVEPNDKWNISNVVHHFKRNLSRNINFVLGINSNDESILVGADDYPRLPLLGIGSLTNFVFKKYILKFRFKIKYWNSNPFPKFNWQKSFYDRRIRNEHELDSYWEYIRFNPIKHRMPSNWPFVFDQPQYADLIDGF